MCVIIVGLLKVRHSAAKILTLLRPLKVNEYYVYHVKKLFEETVDVAGQPCSTRIKMWQMQYMFESIETIAMSKKSFPKR